MTTVALILYETRASGLLIPALFAEAFTRLARARPGALHAAMTGQELRVALALAPTDAATVAFPLDFLGQGKRVRGVARGPSAVLLGWAFHELARTLRCKLVEEDSGAELAPEPDALSADAREYLESYEAEVRAARRGRSEEDGAAFLAWLAREEQIALSDDGAVVAELAAALPMDDASALYEMLLESDAVDDVFASEREVIALLERFKARAGVPN